MYQRNDPVQAAFSVLEKATSRGHFRDPRITGAVLDVYDGKLRFTEAFGTTDIPKKVFMIASITKPIIAMAAMILKDRKQVRLSDSVVKFVPEFHGDGRSDVTIEQLLTHSAGLPDQVPQIRELFAAHAQLEDIFRAACRVPLLFRPGTAVSYSNLGVLIIKEIVERVTTVDLKEFLRKHVFIPLEMEDTSLGLGGRLVESTALNQSKNEVNSHYRRDLGAPWGGVHSTASDLTMLLRYFLNPSDSPLKAETAKDMLRNHCHGLNQPWGIGWMLAASHDHSDGEQPRWRRYGWRAIFRNPDRLPVFGIRCSTATFGHYGVSGTIAWADPSTNVSMVLLTTKFVRHSRDGVLGVVSDLVSQL